MKKMTKIAFWENVLKNFDGDIDAFCNGINCVNECPYYSDCAGLEITKEKAKAYIKRYGRKKKNVEEAKPKPVKKWVKCIDNENGLLPLIIGKVYETIFIRHLFICVLDEEGNERAFNERRFEFVEKPTPLEIAKMIRDNGYKFDCKYNETGCGDCKASGLCDTGGYCLKDVIDDYISANEPTVKENLSVEPCEHLINGDSCGNPFDYCVKDCPVNSEIPKPIKLPDFVYSASKNGVGFIDTKNRTFNTNDKGELLINDKPCFATPEEALQVAKKLWSGK